MLRGPLRFRRSPLMPLVLERLTEDSPLTIDLGGIVPDRLADLAPDAIARLPIRVDGRPCELGSVFGLRGAATDGTIECRGDFSRVQRVGMLMARGEIVVHGHVGRHAGERMTGGRLTVHGDAGDWLAAEMAGGTVQVAGNGGDNVAASLPGSVTGVRGGLVLVGGDVGCLAGARMQRGLLAIGGRCGAAAAFEMRAGTVIVAGTVGTHAGMAMQRGSLIVGGPIPSPPTTFGRGVIWSPTFMPLLGGRLGRAGYRPGGADPRAFLAGSWQQWHGDRLTGGRGEIFHRPV